MTKKPSPERNLLCQRCENKCKQFAYTRIIACPNFKAKPVQLEIPLKISKPRKKKQCG